MSSVLSPGTERTRIVAVVLNWNAWADTIACVESLLSSTCVPDQIIICDNGSLDDSVARLSNWGRVFGSFVNFTSARDALASVSTNAPIVMIQVGENLGYAGGNNIGMRYAIAQAAADYVWILNSDVIVHREALEKMVDVAESDATIGIVGSKLLRFDEPDKIQALGGGYIIPVVCHDTQLGSGRNADSAGSEPIELDHIVGASLLVRADAVRSVGPIDESYFLYREETDWCIRMRREGWGLYCCTQATVWHKQSHSIGFKSPLHDYYAIRNMLHLVRKFYPLALPAALGYFACRSIAPKLLRFEFARLYAVLGAFADFAAGISGRSARHSDAMLMRNYLPPHAPAPRPSRFMWRTAVASMIVFTFLAIASALTGVGIATVMPQMTHAVASHDRAGEGANVQ